MARTWRDPSGFRADPVTGERSRPSRIQATALLAGLVLVAGSVAAASYLVEPDRARTFDVFHGSLFLDDSVAPVAVDLATGRPTIRLVNANSQVSATNSADLAVVPLDGGTLLLNRRTGEFNMVDSTGFVRKNTNTGGVVLPDAPFADTAFGVASGASAYIVRTGLGETSAYLVSQATVQSAVDGQPTKPRAFATVQQATSDEPGASAAADGRLWLLTGSGDTRDVTEFSVPADSAPGVQLTNRSHGTVPAPSVIGTATSAHGTAVGILSPGRVQVFDALGNEHTHGFTSPAGLDRVLPASNGAGRLTYLLHGSAGWSVLSVAADGSSVRGPTALTRIPAGTDLIAPAASDGQLYTMTVDNGQLLRITLDGGVDTIQNMNTYPLARQDGKTVEPAKYDDAYTIARGSRVIVNSPSHNDAVVLFTDSSAPKAVPIQKSSAVEVSAAGGAQAITKDRLQPPPPLKSGPSKPVTTPTKPKPGPRGTVAPVNSQIDCATTSQVPHVPSIVAASVGSRSATIGWQYPLLDRQDCEPTTYTVNVSLVSGSAPTPTGTIRIQGALSYTIADLFPDTVYSVSVTAYLNGVGTKSQSRQIRTGPEGPAAPIGVTAVADGAGGWTVQWSSCGGPAQNCVPSASWEVIPQFCDGIGLSTAPDPIAVTADPTSTVQPSAQFPAGESLLGRSLRFVVQGLGENGEIGTPSASTDCVQSWSPPTTSATTLTASVPSSAAIGQSVPVSATLDLGTSPATAVGGLGGTVTFTITGNGQTQTSNPIAFDGSTGRLSATFGAVLPGRPYSVSATITPPGHAAAAASTGAVGVSTASAWPTPAVTASCATSLLSCALTVTITNIASSDANGEQFSLADGSQVRCGNVVKSLSQSGFDPSATAVTATLTQLSGLYGQCSVTIALNESTTSTSPYYGNVTSPSTTVPVDLGSPSVADLANGDLGVDWGSGSGSTVALSYMSSTFTDAVLGELTSGWSETLTAPNGTTCGTDNEQPSSGGVSFTVSSDCVNRYGGSTSGWTVTVSYTNAVDGSAGPTLTYQLSGPPPGYQPCNPGTLSAAWGATIADGVTVTSGADPSAIAGCSGWTYELDDPTQTQCTAPTNAGPPPANIPVSCGTPPSLGDWTVLVTYNDTAGTPQSQSIAVTGDPPTS